MLHTELNTHRYTYIIYTKYDKGVSLQPIQNSFRSVQNYFQFLRNHRMLKPQGTQ